MSAKTAIPVPPLDCYLSARSGMSSADAAARIARVPGVTVEYLITEKAGRDTVQAALCRWGFLLQQLDGLSPKRQKIITDLVKMVMF